MRDTAADRQKVIEHLETALTLSDELNQPVLGYLIERAIDEARAADFPISSVDAKPALSNI
jgi:hypothetical protein